MSEQQTKPVMSRPECPRCGSPLEPLSGMCRDCLMNSQRSAFAQRLAQDRLANAYHVAQERCAASERLDRIEPSVKALIQAMDDVDRRRTERVTCIARCAAVVCSTALVCGAASFVAWLLLKG